LLSVWVAPAAAQTTVDSAHLRERDPVDLARRFRGVTSIHTPPVNPPALTLGHQQTFSVVNLATERLFSLTASVRLVSEHAYWFVDQSMDSRISAAALQRSAEVFESRTFPLITANFGALAGPGIDGDPRIVLVIGAIPAVAGYFSANDAYPREVVPNSNEREMVYLNAGAILPGTPGFDSTLAHEFEHLITSERCPTQEAWIDEGAAQLASRVLNGQVQGGSGFRANPSVQLNAWSTDPNTISRHYEASYLFLTYAVERAGGFDSLPTLFGTCARGEGLIENFLPHTGAGSLPDLLADWAVTNLLNGAPGVDPRYSYRQDRGQITPSIRLVPGAELRRQPLQFSGDYIAVAPGATLRFQGQTSTQATAGVQSGSAGQWWSNRSDSIDTRVLLNADLSGVSAATATFRAWYDIESNFDFAYFVVSTDGGHTWRALPGRASVSDGELGASIGQGWTGKSGGGTAAAWVDEEVDLSAFAGQQVLLGFEYLTDQAYAGPGFLFDDFAISATGLAEPTDWLGQGWVNADQPIAQTWSLRLVEQTASGPVVSVHSVAADGTAEIAVRSDATSAVLVTVPTAPRTLVRADYTLRSS
jgi:hypothetical protein